MLHHVQSLVFNSRSWILKLLTVITQQTARHSAASSAVDEEGLISYVLQGAIHE
jgi:hypothetical protein